MNTLTPRALRTFSLSIYTQQVLRPRYLSTTPLLFKASAAATAAPTSSQQSKSISSVNGPISTLPAPLSVPERKPGQPFFFRYAFSLGKAYATFYKTGVKNIYTNFKLSQPIQHDIDNNHNHSLPDAVAAGALTRSDFQLLTRNWHDIKRVPIFGLLFAICGEFTPLVVISFSNVVPWTCRIPKQITSDRLTLEKRRSISFRNLTSTKSGNVEELGRMELIHISWSLGLSSSAWDLLGGKLPGLPTGILKGKVRRRVEYLGMDDKLIREEGGVKGMEEEEVRMACVERGIDVCGRSGEHVRESLDAWLKSSVEWPIERLLLTRPSVWPTKPKSLSEDKGPGEKKIL